MATGHAPWARCFVRYYRTSRGWKWVVRAKNGKVVDRADEPFSSKTAARRAFIKKIDLLDGVVENDSIPR